MHQDPNLNHYKTRIARQFSRAATRYDSLARVQADIAADALGLLPSKCHTLLDIGCGTGSVTQQLAEKSEQLIAMDLAMGMLQHARSRADNNKDIYWLQGDAEHLALSTCSVDTVFSSMVLQWCATPAKVMREINRVLKIQGQAVLAIMCEGSFTELQQVWAQLDGRRHINQFQPAALWQQAAQGNGMSVKLTSKSYQTWHPDLRTLLTSIKGIGANVLLANDLSQRTAAVPMLNRTSLAKLEAFYLALGGDNRQLPLSYRIAFLHCVKLKG